MKRIISSILIMAVLFIALHNSLCAEEGPPLNENIPDIKFEEKVFDFGEVYRGAKVTHAFKFKNQGWGLLKIDKIRTSCGCTAADIASKEIEPGGIGEVEVTFYSGSYNGKVSKRVYVHSNDPDENIVMLEIRGEVKIDVDVRPKRLHFGEIYKGEEYTWKLTVMPVDIKDLEIKKLETESEFISMKKEKYREKGKEGYEVTVTLSPDAPEGDFYEMMEIYTSSSIQPVIYVPISGKILGDIRIFPEEINFDISHGDSATFQITLDPGGRRDLYISRVGDELGYFTAQLLLLVHKGMLGEEVVYRLKLQPTSDAPWGPFNEALEICTEDVKQPTLRIKMSGVIK